MSSKAHLGAKVMGHIKPRSPTYAPWIDHTLLPENRPTKIFTMSLTFAKFDKTPTNVKWWRSSMNNAISGNRLRCGLIYEGLFDTEVLRLKV